MSTGGHPASVSLGRLTDSGRWRRELERASPPAAVVRGIGATALVAAVCGSAWIAVGSADGNYLLELPTTGNPRWIDGPLRGLTGAVGSLTPSRLSAGLIVLAVAYLVALACAGSIPLRFALASVVLANAALMLGPTLVSTDVFGYIAYAREAAVHGLNPYLSPPSSIPHDGILPFVYWKHQASPYGPLFTLLSVPLGFVSAGAALWSYKVAAGIASIVIAILVSDIARHRQLNAAGAAIFVGLNPVLLFYAVSGAHNDLWAVALVVGGLALLPRGRESLGTGAAVAAAAIKVTLGLALPFVVLAARRRGVAIRGAILALVAIALLALVLFGAHCFDQIRRIAADHQFDTAFSGPDRVANVLGTHIGSGVRAACTGGAVAVALIAITRSVRGDPIAAGGWAVLALLASIASLAPWYLVWLLPLAALGRSRRLQVAALLATAYLIAVHLPALGGEPWLSQAKGAPATALP
jgi:Glycosyltransferase family 87